MVSCSLPASADLFFSLLRVFSSSCLSLFYLLTNQSLFPVSNSIFCPLSLSVSPQVFTTSAFNSCRGGCRYETGNISQAITGSSQNSQHITKKNLTLHLALHRMNTNNHKSLKNMLNSRQHAGRHLSALHLAAEKAHTGLNRSLKQQISLLPVF